MSRKKVEDNNLWGCLVDDITDPSEVWPDEQHVCEVNTGNRIIYEVAFRKDGTVVAETISW